MTYSVKEIYYTLQGEGAQAGRAAVFLRFAGCNLWSGVEKDRTEAVCQFCDTDFVGTDGPGGGKFADAAQLARAVFAEWPDHAKGKPYVVCTGGEPLLQLDKAATWRLAETLGGRALVELIVEDTVTCYEGDRAHRHDWGYGCGKCPACELRSSGHSRYMAT